MNINAAFQWKCCPEAEHIALSALGNAAHINPDISALQTELLEETSTRLFDWIDHLVLEDTPALRKELQQAGYVERDEPTVFYHPGAQLPLIALSSSAPFGIAVAVDHIADFLMMKGLERKIEGSLFGNYRKCQFSLHHNTALWLIERRGTYSLQPKKESLDLIYYHCEAIEEWKTRPRSIENEENDLDRAMEIARQFVERMGEGRAAWTILEVEREYWQARNHAAQVQKNRQDRLGMGWSNHDHHTFRSSRKLFAKLVQLFEIVGFRCRERFYAGEEAGWGAQVMEHPDTRMVLFLDVDLAPHEIVQDFAYQQLPEIEKLGTVGLWCALHGDSIVKSGMHHLEAQFMFDQLSEDLAERGVGMMNPFSTFPYLKQAFTAGEKWKVEKSRVEKLLKEGKITDKQAEKFLAEGAIGSHLENLQRREGYKGFNQKNVSIIIEQTDPRK